MTELAKLKAEGKIKHIAVCNFGMEDIKQLFEIGVPIISNQLCYGLLWRGVERGIVQLCEDNGIAIIPWGSLGQGLLCGKFATADDVPAGRARSRIFSSNRPQQRHGEAGLEEEVWVAIDKIRQIAKKADVPMVQLSLAWVMQRQNVGTVLMGARNQRQLESNLAALNVTLSKEILKELDEATREVMEGLGDNLDCYETAANSRIR